MRFDRKLLAVTVACLLLVAGVAIAESPVPAKQKKAEKMAEGAEAKVAESAEMAKSAQTKAEKKSAEAEAVAEKKMGEAKMAHADASDGISLSRISVCEEVQERKPVGEADAFSSEIGQLWCFTRVQNAEAPTQIYHRWYVGDNLVDEIAINVGSHHWRCWSTKTILPSWTGECRVEILTEEGDVIGTKEFQLES